MTACLLFLDARISQTFLRKILDEYWWNIGSQIVFETFQSIPEKKKFKKVSGLIAVDVLETR